MSDEGRKPRQTKYPHARSRQLQEGGYTFLKRVLNENITTGEPVVINVGKNYLEYAYRPGHQTFMDGVSLLEGTDEESLEALREVGEQYRVEQGLEEISNEKQERPRWSLR